MDTEHSSLDEYIAIAQYIGGLLPGKNPKEKLESLQILLEEVYTKRLSYYEKNSIWRGLFNRR